MAQPSILIVEDDPNWQDIFREIVHDAGFSPVLVSSRSGAITALANHTFALAIVDISLSEPHYDDRGGVKVLQEIERASLEVPAVVVTGYATVDLAVETLVNLKAVHFFRKDKFNRREFGQVVKREAMKSLPSQAAETGPLSMLTGREQEVLALLIEGRTNKEIAEALTVTVNTVKKHVQSIFTKLNVDNRAAAVARALNVKH